MSELIKLTGLWKNEKDGKAYLSGGLGYGGRLLVFPNEYKSKDGDPDYICYLAAKKEQEEDAKRKDEIPF